MNRLPKGVLHEPTPRNGFTLVEIVLVLVMIGILSWVMYPQVAAYDQVRLRAAARRIAGDLRYAQSQAITRRVVHGVWFDTSAESFWVFAPTAATAVTDPASRGGTLGIDLDSSTEYQGVEIVSASFGATAGVEFDYFGVPRDTTSTDIATTGRVVLSYQGELDTVEVSPGTGKVVVR